MKPQWLVRVAWIGLLWYASGAAPAAAGERTALTVSVRDEAVVSRPLETKSLKVEQKAELPLGDLAEPARQRRLTLSASTGISYRVNRWLAVNADRRRVTVNAQFRF